MNDESEEQLYNIKFEHLYLFVLWTYFNVNYHIN